AITAHFEARVRVHCEVAEGMCERRRRGEDDERERAAQHDDDPSHDARAHRSTPSRRANARASSAYRNENAGLPRNTVRISSRARWSWPAAAAMTAAW